MNPLPITLDRWLVHPPELLAELRGRWLGTLGNALMRARLACHAVEALATLEELPARLQGAPGDQVLRIVVRRFDDALSAALAKAFDDGQALPADVQFYAFDDQPLEVMATLCVPEPGLRAAALAEVALTLGGRPLPAAPQRRFIKAVAAWRKALDAVTQDPAAEPPASPAHDDRPFDFDWDRPTVLAPDTVRNTMPSLEYMPVWAGVTQPPPPGPRSHALRWTALVQGIPGAALIVELLPPDASGTTLELRVSASGALPPAPPALLLRLANRKAVGPWRPLHWTRDDERPGHRCAAARLAIDTDAVRSLRQQAGRPIELVEWVAAADAA